MCKKQLTSSLFAILISLGLNANLSAAENNYVQRADAIFTNESMSLIKQINGECGPSACGTDPCADPGCGDACGLDGCALSHPCEGFDLGETIFGEDSSWDLGGWMQTGYHTRNDGVFNTYPNHIQTQQAYIYLEKVADGSKGFDIGGRADFLYGTDAQNTQSFGNNPGEWDFQNGWDHGQFGFANPQLYGEIAMGDLSVKIGHFYTLLGYQVVPATGNFFYSIPYTFNFSEAFTHTGVLATYKASEDVTLYGGWTLGWDTGFDQLNQGSNFLGGASVKVTDDLTVTYITTIGNLGWLGQGYTHSIVADWVINDKWEYVFQTDVDAINETPAGTNYDTIGANNYLFYTISDKIKLGGRGEWWRVDGRDLYETAFGVNIMPTSNLRIRPEVRYNWSNENLDGFTSNAGSSFNNDVFGDQVIFAIDAVMSF
jgi:hypothetical protein